MIVSVYNKRVKADIKTGTEKNLVHVSTISYLGGLLCAVNVGSNRIIFLCGPVMYK